MCHYYSNYYAIRYDRNDQLKRSDGFHKSRSLPEWIKR